MHTFLLELLECPDCHGVLDWTIAQETAGCIEQAEARCRACGASYPVRDGIGIFLLPDLPRNDMWEQAGTGLGAYLREHPEVQRRLMEPPAGALNPADQFFRAMTLEDQGRYGEAQALETLANAGVYTPEYMRCWSSQIDYVAAQLAGGDTPVVDLASGRAYLAEQLLRRLDRPVVVTDFSARVLRRDRAWLGAAGLLERASLLAFDARRTPFKDKALATLTTNLGLPNIAEPGSLLAELRRITAGTFYAVSHFYPEDDAANRSAIRAAGLEPMLYRSMALPAFEAVGWRVEVENACTGAARPTPTSALLEGAGIDTFPVAETHLEWCVLRAR
jgi:uncharacterized protein YbaR (Trm112 family)